jgi:hypothetical protein
MTLDDLVIPGSPAATASLEVASAYESPALLNHSLRAYVWAAADGVARGIDFDPELLYVAAMFHDIGLVPAFDSHTLAFEEAGGHVAGVFAAGAGWPAERRERLSEVIIRHMWPQVELSMDPEGHLLARSTGADISGRNLDDWEDGFKAEVLRRYPRLDLSQKFLGCFRAQAERKPNSSAAAAIRSGLSTRMTANPLDAPAEA